MLDRKLVEIDVENETVEKKVTKNKSAMKKKEEQLVRKLQRMQTGKSTKKKTSLYQDIKERHQNQLRALQERQSTNRQSNPLVSIPDDSVLFSSSAQNAEERDEYESEQEMVDAVNEEYGEDDLVNDDEFTNFDIYDGYWTDLSLGGFFNTLQNETTDHMYSSDRWLKFIKELYKNKGVNKTEKEVIDKVISIEVFIFWAEQISFYIIVLK